LDNLTKLQVTFHDMNTFRMVIGNQDKNIKVLGSLFGVSLFSKGDDVFVDNDDPDILHALNDIFSILIPIVEHHVVLSERDIIYVAKLVDKLSHEEILDLYTHRMLITKTVTGRPIYAKTINQRRYIQAIANNDLVFGVGPAGTGKTYVAVMDAVSKLREGSIKKLILTRPAVEAGENLGFLPGDLKEKIDPYLRPLYDALYEAFGTKQTEEMIEKGTIEIAPLAYMRGRTLEQAYVILDEAQNTTMNQMKLFLTRLGFQSKMVVTGDITQIDLPEKTYSGLVQAIQLLDGVDGIDIVHFERIDVIRHPLVQQVLARYEAYENKYRKLF
jgi:phosphate starvation-inducible PhoH-like protein